MKQVTNSRELLEKYFPRKNEVKSIYSALDPLPPTKTKLSGRKFGAFIVEAGALGFRTDPDYSKQKDRIVFTDGWNRFVIGIKDLK